MFPNSAKYIRTLITKPLLYWAPHWAPETVVVWPQITTNNHAVALSLLPPPWWDGEENQKEKVKLVGWDENSLT